MKPSGTTVTIEVSAVAPRRGAWVETSQMAWQKRSLSRVAPRRGAWVETSRTAKIWSAILGRTPQGCVG